MTQTAHDEAASTPEGSIEYVVVMDDESMERELERVPWARLVFLHCDRDGDRRILRYGARPN